MGIQGLTKFINDRTEQYFDKFELKDCTLIVDGHSVSCQLYNWKHWQFDARSNSCYGGDYDKYAYIVEIFFGMLKEVNVTAIVVFDGGFEARKFPTIMKRMQDKINIGIRLDSALETRSPNNVVFPLLLRDTFKDVLRNLDIQMVMCEFEGDTEIASLAQSLDCPVLTFDSDYFLYGVKYIPFKSLDSKVTVIKNWRTGTYKCMICQVYRIDKFLKSFPGLEENTLYLLPVLLGNDYISSNLFEKFLASIDVEKTCEFKLNLILDWLKLETSAESAIHKILKSFKNSKEKLFMLNKIQKVVSGYYFIKTPLLDYLNIKTNKKKKIIRNIDFESIKTIIESETNHCDDQENDKAKEAIIVKTSINEIIDDDSLNDQSTAKKIKIEYSDDDNNIILNECPKTETEKTTEQIKNEETVKNEESKEIKIEPNTCTIETVAKNSVEEFSFEETNLEQDSKPKNEISELFVKNLTKALYPSSFMDILSSNRYYCIPQVENSTDTSSHIISFSILSAIHKILTNSKGEDFQIVARSEGCSTKYFSQDKFELTVPTLEQIEELPLQEKRNIIFKILNIDNGFLTLLEHFPTEWHTFLIALKFASGKTTFDTPLIYSLILIFIILNYIDQRIGFFRSTKRFMIKYYSFMQNVPASYKPVPFRVDKNCFYYFPLRDCTVFMEKVINMFQMNRHENSYTFDRKLIHQMAQIQSVLLHIKYLNLLLKHPYPNVVVHQILDCTFIYNLTKTFQEKSNELENNYLNVFFSDCPSILAGLKYVLNLLNKEIVL